MSYKLTVNPFQPGVGTVMTWTSPTLINNILTGGVINSGKTIDLYLQRSLTKSNWPLQPAHSNVDTINVPVVEAGWETIQVWNLVAGNTYVTTATDNTPPSPLFYYRLIAFVDTAGGGVAFNQIDWIPGVGLAGAPSGSIIKATQYSVTSRVIPAGVCVDSAGNRYVAYYFKGSGNVGGSTLTSVSGTFSMIVAKYDNAGVHQWSVSYGGAGDITPRKIKVDSAGNVYVCGNHTGVGNFGGGNTTVNTAFNQYNLFIASYSGVDGSHRWSKSYGATATNFSAKAVCVFWDMGVDSSNNVSVGGYFAGTINVGGSDLNSTNLTAQCAILAQYASDGTHVFSQTFTTATGGESCIVGVGIDSSDSILTCGYFFTSLNLASNDSEDETIFTDWGSSACGFVAKFDNVGNWIWSFARGQSPAFGRNQGNRFEGLAVDPDDNVFVTGRFYKNGNFGGDDRVGQAVDNDSVIAKYSGTDGSYLWDQPLRSNNGCWSNCLAVDALKNVYASGFYYGTLNCGTGFDVTSRLVSYDGFTAKLNTTGTPQWLLSFGGNGSGDGATGITVNNNFPLVVGSFNQTAFFGNFTFTAVGIGADTVILQIAA